LLYLVLSSVLSALQSRLEARFGRQGGYLESGA
ncbi:MAG: cysteine ABC transporter permease, partial [Aurantimonas sp.]|nr:cysteine ABC transporter permease [Aurantimonas sp.]